MSSLSAFRIHPDTRISWKGVTTFIHIRVSPRRLISNSALPSVNFSARFHLLLLLHLLHFLLLLLPFLLFLSIFYCSVESTSLFFFAFSIWLVSLIMSDVWCNDDDDDSSAASFFSTFFALFAFHLESHRRPPSRLKSDPCHPSDTVPTKGAPLLFHPFSCITRCHVGQLTQWRQRFFVFYSQKE